MCQFNKIFYCIIFGNNRHLIVAYEMYSSDFQRNPYYVLIRIFYFVYYVFELLVNQYSYARYSSIVILHPTVKKNIVLISCIPFIFLLRFRECTYTYVYIVRYHFNNDFLVFVVS